MDWLGFVAAIVKAVAWPVTWLVILPFFRKPLRELIPRLQTIRIGSVEASVAREYHEEANESLGASDQTQRLVQEYRQSTRGLGVDERDGDEPSGN